MYKRVLKNKKNISENGFGHLAALLFAALVIVIGVSAYFVVSKSKKDSANDKPLTPVTVRLNWLHQAQFAGLYAAKEKGYYADAGLNVSLKEYEDGVDANSEVASGTVHFSISTPLETVLSRDKGDMVKAVAAIYQTSPYVIVTRKEANIVTPSDFKGKILGNIGGNKQAAVTYASLLANAGLSAKDTTIKDIGFDIVEEFKNKSADSGDVYRTDQTYLLDKAGIEYNFIFPEQYGFSIYGDCIITSDKMISENRDLVKSFVQASLKGWEYAVNNPEDALSATAVYENELYKDADYESHILTTSIDLIKPTGNQKIGAMQYIPWNKAFQGFESSGLLQSDLAADSLYTSQFVE